MSDVLAGAPDEVVTNAIMQMVSLSAFGATGNLALITLDNGKTVVISRDRKAEFEQQLKSNKLTIGS